MAEAIFAEKVRQSPYHNDISCDSCGTASYHIGENPDSRTLAILNSHHVPVNHKGRQLSHKDFEIYDYILAMDSKNYDNIIAISHGSAAKVLKMRQFDPDYPNGDVPDPYYGVMKDFENVYTILEKCCENLFNHIIANDLK